MLLTISCFPPPAAEVKIPRKYKLVIADFWSHTTYSCDTVIWVSDRHLQLKDDTDSIPWADVIIPMDARVTLMKTQIK